jgi:predicted RNA-binding protein with PUA-like domain
MVCATTNNMKAMKLGDKAFFYHSVNEKQVVGTLEVVKEYYPDPSDKSERFGMVDFKALKPLKTPVTLQQVKDDPRLEDLALVRQSRLSVMPIDAKSWKIICGLGSIKP